MFTKLSDWRKRELGNRVPNALRPDPKCPNDEGVRMLFLVVLYAHLLARLVLVWRGMSKIAKSKVPPKPFQATLIISDCAHPLWRAI
jgi:hypothetical protein